MIPLPPRPCRSIPAAPTPALTFLIWKPIACPHLAVSHPVVKSKAPLPHTKFSPFASPYEILWGEILWLSLDLSYWLRREVRWHFGNEEMLNREASAEFCWCHRFLTSNQVCHLFLSHFSVGHRCWVLLLILGLVPSETRFCSKALCGLSSIQHCKTVAWGGCVGYVGFKNVCSSSKFLVLSKARSFFSAHSVLLTCCCLLPVDYL